VVWAYLLFASAAGVVLPFQAGINAELAGWLHSPVRAAFVSFVVATIVLLVAALIALVVAGQGVASLVVDHFGWVGFEPRHVTPGRLVSIALVGAGVLLVRIF
jgi:transporter family-2 protein